MLNYFRSMIGGTLRNCLEEVDGVLTGHESQIRALEQRVADLEALVSPHSSQAASTSEMTA